MNDVTLILEHLQQGDATAAEKLLPLVYDELRRLAAHRMAHENPGQTLQATALVHEAYMRLVGAERAKQWDSRGHFFAAAAEAMRRIMVENARRKQRVKHGGQCQRIDIQVDDLPDDIDTAQLIALDEALQQLGQDDPVKAKLVVLHFFGGMTMQQAADVLDISRATAHRYWVYARAWLFRQIAESAEEDA